MSLLLLVFFFKPGLKPFSLEEPIPGYLYRLYTSLYGPSLAPLTTLLGPHATLRRLCIQGKPCCHSA